MKPWDMLTELEKQEWVKLFLDVRMGGGFNIEDTIKKMRDGADELLARQEKI
jgi:hypothetical protein